MINTLKTANCLMFTNVIIKICFLVMVAARSGVLRSQLALNQAAAERKRLVIPMVPLLKTLMS